MATNEDFREVVFSVIVNGIFSGRNRDATDVYREMASDIVRLATEHFAANSEGWRRLAFSARVMALHEAADLIMPKGSRPCDCQRCDCGNIGDAEEVRAWDEGMASATAILALAEGKEG